jgi:hypothetical protein
MKETNYHAFLERKRQLGGDHGFAPLWLPDFLYPFQYHLTDRAIRKGRSAMFADCGLGKSPAQLVWAENVVRKTNRPVLIGTPLAVSQQLLVEAEKFGVEAVRSRDGSVPAGARIVVTNYEQLHKFAPASFAGMVVDESSILKNYDGTRRKIITEFMRTLPHRLLTTATAAPNDWEELGTSSEALGELGHVDMLNRFFTNRRGSTDLGHSYGAANKWYLKPHAVTQFWRWVSSWAQACRSPEDLGFKDDRFILPELVQNQHVIEAQTKRDGCLFAMPANGRREELEARRRTITERCEKVAELVDHGDKALVWCHLNSEADLLERLIPDALQVSGSMPDELKEERLIDFARGDLRVLVTKPKIGAWGLNLQCCAHVTWFPDHSYEQYYQAIRRCWRFGQTKPVTVDIVMTEDGANIMANMRRKARQADEMFDALIKHMNDAARISPAKYGTAKAEVPAWL